MTQSGGTRRRTRRVLWRADPLDAGQAIVWARDGRKLFYRVGDSGSGHFVAVVNWFEEFEARVPVH